MTEREALLFAARFLRELADEAGARQQDLDSKRDTTEYDSGARLGAAISYATHLHSVLALEEEAERLQQTEIPQETP